ncbi:MAG: potassium channel family protein, partial [Betaproteobacteria bacterium]|nr:potassium channel family protein [Betaproteobacteria bacterium]
MIGVSIPRGSSLPRWTLAGARPLFTLLQIFRESPYYPKFRGGFLVIVAVHLLGTMGYLAISGWQAPVMDALYMTFNVVTTLGFAETVEAARGTAGRLFTMVVAFFGIAGTWYLFSTFTAFILETNLNQAYRRRRMERTISTLSGHYIVCGIGRVGGYVADELIKTEREFVVIDANPETLLAHEARTGHKVQLHGDAADDDLLVRAGVARAAGVFAVTGDDSKNLVVSLSTKQLNPAARVVARVHDRRNVDKTRRAGADEIVSPDFTGGLRIASAMLRPNAVNLMDMMLHTADNLRVEEVLVPRGTTVTTVEGLGRRREWLLVAIRDAQSRWSFNPAPDTAILPGDTIVAMV